MILKLLNPNYFDKLSRGFLQLLAIFSVLFICIGVYLGLVVSPVDYQQGDMVRIMYVHVPSAWMALGIYTFIAVCSFINLVWNIPMCYIASLAASYIGATFALITLVTGSIWGRPIWGTWWVWDARLTSMLVLFFMYIAYIAVAKSGDNLLRAQKPASSIAMIGFVNVPIVKFSVDIWHSLHQPASVMRIGGPTIHSSMLLPLFTVFIGFICFFLLTLIVRIRNIKRNIHVKVQQ